MTLKLIRLAEFLSTRNEPAEAIKLPLVHTTESVNLIGILNKKKILATACNVFPGEKLCYLFVGRPAYKYILPGEAPYWTLPTVFVVRFEKPPPFKRLYPFDSGAFSRFPKYIACFARDDFEFGPDASQVDKLISVFFQDEKRYWSRRPQSEVDFRERHLLGPLHMQLEALNRLYSENSSIEFDDRAAAVEVQIANDVPIDPSNLLGVVVPDQMLKDKAVEEELRSLTSNIRTYSIHPISAAMYFGQIYTEVQSIYRVFGIGR